MTFSIVAADVGAGVCGVAVATARPSVGGRCIVLRPGIGAAATQAIVRPALGVDALDRLAGGHTPDEAVTRAVAADAQGDRRQLSVVDVSGRSAAKTGAAVGGWCGHEVAAGIAVAGNLLTGPEVVAAAMAAFRSATGDLADRLLAALLAGQAQGGDRRGQESAALVVVGSDPWPIVDVRVDHAPRPVDDLAVLLDRWRSTWQAYEETGIFPPADPPGAPPTAVSPR